MKKSALYMYACDNDEKHGWSLMQFVQTSNLQYIFLGPPVHVTCCKNMTHDTMQHASTFLSQYLLLAHYYLSISHFLSLESPVPDISYKCWCHLGGVGNSLTGNQGLDSMSSLGHAWRHVRSLELVGFIEKHVMLYRVDRNGGLTLE
jgi:hypothetical protein